MPVVETYRPASREEWLELRREDVTASVIAALFADPATGQSAHPYMTELTLYLEKTGGGVGGPASDILLEIGHALEPVAVNQIRAMHPEWEVEHSNDSLTYYRDPDARIGATPDVIVRCPERGRGVIQIKAAAAEVLSGRGARWVDAEGEPDAPLWIHMQTEVERVLADADWGMIARLRPSGLELYDLHSPPGLYAAMVRRVRAFWERVKWCDMPLPDLDRDAMTIAQMYAAEDEDEALDLTADAEIEAMIERLEALSTDRATITQEIARLRAGLRYKLGAAPVAYLAGGRQITNRTERRRGGYQPPTEARVLRLPRSRGDHA